MKESLVIILVLLAVLVYAISVERSIYKPRTEIANVETTSE